MVLSSRVYWCGACGTTAFTLVWFATEKTTRVTDTPSVFNAALGALAVGLCWPLAAAIVVVKAVA